MQKTTLIMKRLIFLLSVVALLTSCGIFTRSYISDYGEQIKLLKTNFPEIYNLYCQGSVIIDDVYIYEEDGKERVGISYRYR